MAITVGTSDGRVLSLEGTAVTIGSSPGCGVPFPGTSLRAEHAVLRRMAGRWFVEAAEECLIPATGGDPVRMVWVSAGDRVKLSASGPEIVFEPVSAPSNPSAAPADPLSTTPPASSPPKTISLPAPTAWQSSGTDGSPERTRESAISRPAPSTVRGEKGGDSEGAPVAATSAGTHPAIWALGGGALVLAGIIAAGVVLSMSNQRGAPLPVAGEVLEPPTAATTQSLPVRPPASTKPNLKPSTTTTYEPAQLFDGLYTVFVQHPDRDELFRLGTAWAIDEHRLVTSGAVVQGLEELKSSAPQASVGSPQTRSHLTITSTVLHPVYKQSAAAAKAAQDQADTARLNLEQNKDEARIEALTQAVVAAEEQSFQAFEKLVDYDVGVLVVKESLPIRLPVAKQPGSLKAGTQVDMLGVPFRVDEYLADRDAPASAGQRRGTIFTRLPSPAGSTGIQRLLLKFRDDLINDNWSGAPVLNLRGEVIAIYSRPTPPPAAAQPTTAVPTQDAVEIERLFEIVPTLR